MPQLGIDRKARHVIWVGDLEASPRPGRVGAASAQRGPRVRFSGLQAPGPPQAPRPHTAARATRPWIGTPRRPPPPAGIATGAHTARSTPPGRRRPHPDRPTHQRGPMAAPAPDDPRRRLCANLRKVGSAALSAPAQPRRPSGGRCVTISLPWATTRPCAPRRPCGGSCRPCRTAPGVPAPRSWPPRPPCALFGHRPSGPSRVRA